jgi:hypothetical protein
MPWDVFELGLHCWRAAADEKMVVDEAVAMIDAADEKMAAAAEADEAAGRFWLTHSVSIARLSFRLSTKLLIRSHSHTLPVQDKWQHELPAAAGTS